MSKSQKVKRKTLFAFRVHEAVVERYRTLTEAERKSILHQLKLQLYTLVRPASRKSVMPKQVGGKFRVGS